MNNENLFTDVSKETLIELLDSYEKQMSNNIHRLEADSDLSASTYFTAWYFQLSSVMKTLKDNPEGYTKSDVEDLVRAVSCTMLQFDVALGRSINI